MPSITFQQDDGTEIRVELVAATISFGKGSENDIVLEDSSISTRHGQISFEDEAFFITDLGSTNGTIINGENISKHRLKSGDRIEIGTLTGTFRTGEDQPEKTRPKDSDKDSSIAPPPPKVRKPATEQKPQAPARAAKTRHGKSPPRAASGNRRGDNKFSDTLKGISLPGNLAKKSPDQQPEGIGFYLFLMQFLVVIVAMAGMSMRHYIETGGFFLSDAFHEIRHIETEGPVYDAEGNLVEDDDEEDSR